MPLTPERPQPMISPEQQQTAEVLSEEEEQPTETIENKPSQAGEDQIKKENVQIERDSDLDIVLDFILEQDIDHIDSGLFNVFIESFNQKHQENPKEIADFQETILFLKELPGISQQFNERIATLKGTENYKEIEQKKNEIIKGLAHDVLNGHLSAEDVISLVGEINLVSKDNPPDELKGAEKAAGYDGVMFYDERNHKIIIFEETLVDQFKDGKGQPMKLDFRHMINHEMSHAITERVGLNNERLLSSANDIIKNAESIIDIQPEHIQNVLLGLKSIEAEYEKLSDEVKQKVSVEQYRNFRIERAANEIITDYTTVYLQTDGSFEEFALKAIKMAKIEHPESVIGVSKEELKSINESSPEQKGQLIEQLRNRSGKFNKLIEIYQTFHTEIDNAIKNNKDSFAETEEDEFDLDELSLFGGGFMEAPEGFEQTGFSNQTENKGFMKEIGAFIAAFAQEIGMK